ncbi:hypothetical protein [Streptomyces sp. MJM8645]|uniref:hypothetical protein n=1 Tax=Streptomycetaceae TaxID=2062 RepID=UPI0007AF705F|nr:hypothetical protein [Streptomyces sp. MJM8645]
MLVVTRAAYLKLYPDEGELTRGYDYIVINGCRRQMAATKYGRAELFGAVNDDVAKTRASLMRAAYDENVERRDFDAVEDAQAVMSIVAEYPSQREAAAAEGWSEGYISQRKAILGLHPQVQAAAQGIPFRELRRFATKAVRDLLPEAQRAALKDFLEELEQERQEKAQIPRGARKQTARSVRTSPQTQRVDQPASSPGRTEEDLSGRSSGAETTTSLQPSTVEDSTEAGEPNRSPVAEESPEVRPSFTAVEPDRAASEFPTPRGSAASGTLPGTTQEPLSDGLNWTDPVAVANALCANMTLNEAFEVARIVLERLDEHTKQSA